MRCLLILVLVVLPMPSSGTAATARYKAWQWQRAIVPAGERPADEQCVVLDADLYRAAAPGLRDVRLLQQGREIAYALQESYDERALRIGAPGESQADRSLYSTVLQIPLEASASGKGMEHGAAMLARQVPVERMELVPLPTGSTVAAQTVAKVHLRLVATPTGGSSPTPEGELIEDELDANHPVELTAIGANLQSGALVDVTVAGSERFARVLLQMRQRSLCYQPLSAAPLLLLYGNPEARPQRYDYAVHYRPTATPLLAALGPAQLNPEYHARDKAAFRLTRVQRLGLAAVVAIAGFLLTAVPLLRRP